MKRLFTICFSLLLTFHISGQDACEQGSLLLEGDLAGVAFNSLNVKQGIGIYLSDRFAVVSGLEATLTGDGAVSFTSLGGRIHFTEDKLMAFDLALYEDEDYEYGSVYVFGIGLKYAQRYYFKDWISIQPYTGLAYTIIDGEDGVLNFKSGIAFNLHFERY